MGKIIGIDLGTTNSVVSVMEGSDPVVIPNQEGARTTPSIVAYQKDGEVLVGQVAKRGAVTNPEATIFSAKRFIGQSFEKAKKDIDRVPYTCIRTENGDVSFEINSKRIAPPAVSAHVLGKLKDAAEAFLGEKVTGAVITVPAYFNDAQRQATRDAGKIAGLDVKRIVNEPTAAALAYGLDKQEEELVAVYDLGGGTFDISILEVGDGVVEVKSTNGDTQLGGDDFDHVIIDWLLAEFKKDQGMDVSGDKMVLQRLKEAAEKAKIELSSALSTDINLPFLTADQTGPKHLNVSLTRSKFEQMIGDLVERSLQPCAKALKDAGVSKSEINEVILVGGSSRVPLVQEKVSAFFGKEPHKRVNPDEVVAMGAAVQAGVLSGDVTDILLLDVTPLTLGIETLGGVVTPMIPRNTTIPTRKTEVFSTAADNQTSVTVHVTQGERKMASDNKTLGKFNLDEIPPAPRNVPQIEVTFEIDANGIVEVKAKDKATGKEQHITIEAQSGLSDADIEAAIAEAEANKEADEQRQKLVQTRNELDTLTYQIEKLVKEQDEKLDDEDKSKATAAIEEARATLEGDDLDAMTAAKEKLDAVAQEIGTKLYSAGVDPNAAAGGAASEAGSDEDIIDAEFDEN